MNTPVYIRAAFGDGEWHYIGRTTEFGIELKRDYLNKENRTMIGSESYYIEIKP